MQSVAKKYTIPAFGLLLRDSPDETASALERQFNDLFHLFLNRFANLTNEVSLPEDEAADLQRLLSEIIAVKQKLDSAT